jgi:protein TonB
VEIEDASNVPVGQPGVPGGIGVGDANGAGANLITSIIGTGSSRPRPPEPPKEPAATKTPETAKPARITEVKMAEPIQRVNPVYPALARQMRVSGKVELRGVLGVDGRIHELQVISGHPLLVKAAVDAVMQWVYRPTILNGQPVEVQAPITVNFILNQ